MKSSWNWELGETLMQDDDGVWKRIGDIPEEIKREAARTGKKLSTVPVWGKTQDAACSCDTNDDDERLKFLGSTEDERLKFKGGKLKPKGKIHIHVHKK